jgi:hypothetical protein
MISNQWFIRAVGEVCCYPRYPAKTVQVTGFTYENQYDNSVTAVTHENDSGGNLCSGATPVSPDHAPVNCSTCRHALPATPGDAYCWHTCRVGVKQATGWGMVARKCDRWEVHS